MRHAPLCLASRSPRRRELLAQIGIYPKTMAADIDESPGPGEAPAEYVIRLALEKARAVQAMPGDHEALPVLAADTAVVAAQRILGKPADREEALAMMRQLSGRSHKVLTAVALVDAGKAHSRLSVSQVTFRRVTEAEAEAYWDSGEPRDKAGGYAIQGLGAIFISHLEGSYSGVMGLPLFETAELLALAGIGLPNPKTSR